MKKIYSILTGILVTASVWSQAPQKMSYQAVIRNGSNALVTSTNVGMKISVLQGSATGTAVYVETQLPTTNSNGLASLEIGNGTVATGTFSSIDWANGPYFIKTETDPTGSSNYTIVGISQLLSVPYALYSGNALPSGGQEGQIITFCSGIPTWTTAGVCPGMVASLNCATANNIGTLTQSNPASGVSSVISYTSGNGGSYIAQTITSTGVTGLTANLQAGSFANGNGTLTYTIFGTPTSAGTASFAINIGGKSCTLTLTVNPIPNCISVATAVVPVTNPTTGKIWMDRNLGASQVATSSTDVASFGDLYQWGRGSDGHQCRTSATTTTLSTTDVPGNSNFILAPAEPNNWQSIVNNNLWQGVNGINNPCPSGYRIPTNAEFDAERASWSSQNAVGAYASRLKLTLAGERDTWDGSLKHLDAGFYWTSNWSQTSLNPSLLVDQGGYLYFGTVWNIAYMNSGFLAPGRSVRCIKN